MKFYTITSADVGQFAIQAFGRVWPVSDFLGRVLPQDVGKRVYLRDGVLQVENYAQRDARLTARPEPVCECTESVCPVTVADTGQHPEGPRCSQPAVMHLFPVVRHLKGPVDFCEPCGDDALQSGLFATGEDVAAARRDPDEDDTSYVPGDYDPPEGGQGCSHVWCGGDDLQCPDDLMREGQ